MTIPPYKDIMLPFLRSLSDGKVHSLKELYQVLADQMQLAEEARAVGCCLLAHSRSFVIAWAGQERI